MINLWYIAAIIFGALTAFCTYYGATVDSKNGAAEQTARIETQLQALGTQIQSLRLEPESTEQSTKRHALEEKYKYLAEEYFRSVPLRTAQAEARTAKQRVEEIQKTQELETYFISIRSEIEKVIAAYNSSVERTAIRLMSRDVPKNLFDAKENHPAYVMLEFDAKRFWAIRIVSYPNKTMALQIVRLIDPDGTASYDAMRLTNDSINLVITGEQFGISLNTAISDEVRENIAGGAGTEMRPLSDLTKSAAELTRRIIEYELLPRGAPN